MYMMSAKSQKDNNKGPKVQNTLLPNLWDNHSPHSPCMHDLNCSDGCTDVNFIFTIFKNLTGSASLQKTFCYCTDDRLCVCHTMHVAKVERLVKLPVSIYLPCFRPPSLFILTFQHIAIDEKMKFLIYHLHTEKCTKSLISCRQFRSEDYLKYYRKIA